MYLSVLKSKIHNATVTDANIDYEGSISLDEKLMYAVGIIEHEKVLVANVTNGRRCETYAIKGSTGEVCLNGAAAKLFNKGDKTIVMAFAMINDKDAKKHHPKIIHVDSENRIID
jgi:aspartate 1-decarboxylase